MAVATDRRSAQRVVLLDRKPHELETPALADEVRVGILGLLVSMLTSVSLLVRSRRRRPNDEEAKTAFLPVDKPTEKDD
jgi:hypothetical protein